MKFVLLQELGGRWSWELREPDGKLVAVSAMGFGSRKAAIENIRQFRSKAPRSPVCDGAGNRLETGSSAAGTSR